MVTSLYYCVLVVIGSAVAACTKNLWQRISQCWKFASSTRFVKNPLKCSSVYRYNRLLIRSSNKSVSIFRIICLIFFFYFANIESKECYLTDLFPSSHTSSKFIIFLQYSLMCHATDIIFQIPSISLQRNQT